MDQKSYLYFTSYELFIIKFQVITYCIKLNQSKYYLKKEHTKMKISNDNFEAYISTSLGEGTLFEYQFRFFIFKGWYKNMAFYKKERVNHIILN